MPPLVTELAEVYQELAAGRKWSEVLRVDLSEAEARDGRIERLLLKQCEAEHYPCFIYGDNSWTVNAAGIVQEDYERGLPSNDGYSFRIPDDFFARSPQIIFIPREDQVWLSLHFGKLWLWRKEAQLRFDGRLDRETWADITYWTPTKRLRSPGPPQLIVSEAEGLSRLPPRHSRLPHRSLLARLGSWLRGTRH